MDSTDLLTLRLLAEQGRITWTELAQHLSLSGPAAAERVRRLEERGFVRGYGAVLDRETLGYGLTAFVSVDLTNASRRAAFLALVESRPEVMECHHVAGDHDYLLKIASRDTRDLDRFLNEVLKSGNLISRTRTTIVLGSPKEALFVPPESSV